MIAGALAGVAGHMWAMHRGFVNPELIGWHRSAEALLMILLGGLTTLHGPIIGALAYTGLGEVCAAACTERKLLVEGAGHPVRGAAAAQRPERHPPAAPVAEALRTRLPPPGRCRRGAPAWLTDAHRRRRCSPHAG